MAELSQAEITQLIELAELAVQTKADADHIWVLMATALVLLMQGGFLLLEAGMTRSKNTIAVAQKNLADICIAITAFYLLGFALMFGPSLGFFGWASNLAAPASGDSWMLVFLAFQAVFAGTAATIMSGAVAERMKFSAYLVLSAALAGVVYPIFGHWAWGNLLIGDNPSWLADKGFMDFAGSTVVHSAGGWFALAVIIVLGARRDRFDENGKPRQINGHSLVLSAMGAVILLFGWFGFNAGSTVSASADVAAILANTLVAAIFGGTVAVILGRMLDGLFMPARAINGILGGLVGITAGCAFVDMHGAMAIGAICGVIVVASEDIFLKVFKLDDVVGAVSVHGVCGVAGTLLLAVFAQPDMLTLPTRMAQFLVQAEGAAVAFAWFFGTGLVLAWGLRLVGELRVSEEDETRGMNLAEHGVQMSTGVLQEALTKLAIIDRDLTQRLPTDGGDETADMAAILNPFLDEMQNSMRNVRVRADEVARASQAMLNLSETMAQGSAERIAASTQMTASARALHAGSEQATDVVNEVRQQAESLAQKASDMAGGMSSMAETVRDMAMTIHGIAKDADSTAASSETALAASERSREQIGALGQASEAVDEVLTQIREIADKTILLALNARVEAARAGSAGKGFAIVAQEVAELSKQTQHAADRITDRIGEMKSGSAEALDGMREVSRVLAELSQDMNRVRLATQRQDDAINELGQTTQTGASEAQTLSAGIEALRSGTDRIATFAETVRRDSAETTEMAEKLRSDAEGAQKRADQLSESSTALSRGAEDLDKAAHRYRA